MSGYYDRREPETPARMGSLATDIVNAVKPELAQLTGAVAEALQPTISNIVREDVVPAAGPYIIVGMIGLGAVAALIGALLARGKAR